MSVISGAAPPVATVLEPAKVPFGIRFIRVVKDPRQG
jgi:hypothetical protein